jgi:cation diffusion facilitator family transporter
MHIHTLDQWQHSHDFASDRHDAEQSTKIVMALTIVTMVAEVVAGTAFGSMALLADGWHMATHVAAFGITIFAYRYARHHATNPRYTFGTGKVSVLGGFASAVALAVIALVMAIESVERLFQPQTIQFSEAIGVAVLGLVINLASAWLLQDHHDHHHHGHHGHHHQHHGHQEHQYHGHQEHQHQEHQYHGHQEHQHQEHQYHGHQHHGHSAAEAVPDRPAHHQLHHHEHGDHAESPQNTNQHIDQHTDQHTDQNLRAAYVHVLADALTSVLAIVALFAGKAWGWVWMDAVMGIVGAGVITQWAYGLVRDTSAILLDGSVDKQVKLAIVTAIEEDADNRVADLHIWYLHQNHLAATISLVTHHPQAPEHYKQLLSHIPTLSHVLVEVNPCHGEACLDGPSPTLTAREPARA